MENNDESFSPDVVEEQIEQFRTLLPSEDALLVDRLQQLYQSEREENARSLNSVRERIRQRQHFAHAFHERRIPNTTQNIHTQMQIQWQRNRNMRKIPDKPDNVLRLFGTVAATIFVVLLVGSVALVFREAAQRGSSAAPVRRATATPAIPMPAPGPASDLYVASRPGESSCQLDRLDAKSHAIIWSQSIGQLNGFSVTGNVIYVSMANNTDSNASYVYALDGSTGRTKWRTNLVAQNTTTPGLSYPGTLTTPAATSEAVFVIARDGVVVALNASNGHQLWSYDTGLVALVHGTIYNPGDVAVSNGIVYATIANQLFAIDAKSGKKLWSVQADAAQIFNSPQVVNASVYLSSYEFSHHYGGQSQASAIYSYDAKTGKQNWVYPVDDWVLSSPVIADNMVFFGSFNTNIYALRANTGAVVWRYNTGGQVFSSVLVSNGIVYGQEVGNANEGLSTSSTVKPAFFAIDELKGTKLWSAQISTTTLTAKNGILYAGVFPNNVNAFNARNGSVIWSRHYNANTAILQIDLAS